MRETKPFFKITFQDLEIAEEFFDNEKHFSEFILAVSYYYRSKNYQIKNKNVQKYFKTYQKTMDNIIEAKSFGKKGAEIKAENQQVKEETLEGGLKGGLEETLPTNYKVLSINNKLVNNITLFEIKDFNFSLSNFSGNKQYFYLCYRYWELYRKEYPNHMHLKTAKFKEWYDAIRLMVESDKQSIDRIVAIYIFLTKCQNKEKGYETFLFSQVKSLTALRKKTASGEYRLDNLATLVNEKLQKDDEFNRSVKKAIETFKNKFQ